MLGEQLLSFGKLDAEAFHLLGAVAFQQGRLDDAEGQILRAVGLARHNPYFLNSLGNVKRALRDFDAAAEAYRKALRIEPRLDAARSGLGISLRAKGDLDGSATQLQRLVQSQSGNAEAHFELARTFYMQANLGEAVSHYRMALRLNPAMWEAREGLAHALLLAGDFRAGWSEFLRNPTVKLPEPGPHAEPFKGKKVAVFGEQGVGDEIMAAGCLMELAEQARECTLHTDPRLVGLFQRSFPNVRCIGLQKEGAQVVVGAVGRDEFHVLSMMLFPYFRYEPDAHPNRRAYLKPQPEVISLWRQRYAGLGEGLKVGLSWRGGVDPDNRAERSIPLSAWSEVLGVPGVHFINLQYGDCTAELAAVREQQGVTIPHWPDADPFGDLDPFAAQVAALDLVISVDNSTAHMAGALGVPVWILLPLVPDWRWLLGREDTPWYPGVRLMRQERRGEWGPVLARVARDLRSMAGVAC